MPPKGKGIYVGRNLIINMLKLKSAGTKRAVFKALKEMLNDTARKKQVLAIAKANGIRIKILN